MVLSRSDDTDLCLVTGKIANTYWKTIAVTAKKMSEDSIDDAEVDVTVEPLLRSECYTDEYSIDSQISYLVQWLGEFGALEKEDFLQELLHLYAPGQLSCSLRVPPLTRNGKMPTLFDCRMDLLRKWFGAWDGTNRVEFLRRLNSADSDFCEKFEMSKNTPNSKKIAQEFYQGPTTLEGSSPSRHHELPVGESSAEKCCESAKNHATSVDAAENALSNLIFGTVSEISLDNVESDDISADISQTS